MNPSTLRLLATVLEIVGTFFLAAEAIKLPNLRALRERFLWVFVMLTSPVAKSLNTKAQGTELSGKYVGILILVGMVFVYGMMSFRGDSVSELWVTFQSVAFSAPWISIVIAVPVIAVLLLILSLLGWFIVSVLLTPLLLAILLLEFVEKHSANGLIGILGFLFFLAGAILKASWD